MFVRRLSDLREHPPSVIGAVPLLHANTLLVAAIFIPYMAMMLTLFGYMCWQVRDHERPPDDRIRARTWTARQR